MRYEILHHPNHLFFFHLTLTNLNIKEVPRRERLQKPSDQFSDDRKYIQAFIGPNQLSSLLNLID